MSTNVDRPPPAPVGSEPDEEEVVREQLRSHGVRLAAGGIAPAVFWPALAVVAGVALFGVIAPETAGTAFESAQEWIVVNLGWFYTLAVAAFVVFSLVIGLSRFGKVVIKRPGDEPEFGLLSWFSMLFAAGMGIGLVFYGVAEPLTFATVDPKPGTTGDGIEVSHAAMAQTLVHWGLHPWAVYVVIGLALGLAIHKRGRPVSIRWALEPLLGDRVKGRIGDLVDVLAIFGTVFGVATALGLGVQQIGAGLSHMGVIEDANDTVLVVLIVVITFVATASAGGSSGSRTPTSSSPPSSCSPSWRSARPSSSSVTPWSRSAPTSATSSG